MQILCQLVLVLQNIILFMVTFRVHGHGHVGQGLEISVQESHCLGSGTNLPTATSFVNLGNLLIPPLSQFSHLENSESSIFSRLLCELRKIKKRLSQSLKYYKHVIMIYYFCYYYGMKIKVQLYRISLLLFNF